VAGMVSEFLLAKVKEAPSESWFELYSAVYDFLDYPEFRSGELDALCRLDRRSYDEREEA
jgi:hypothetical protein